ncbi:unnamed protein product [Bemisia tabaci]|uniref:Uncharacterized protein n=1 Tax=Bemisia tabaci TaxID=7038 RepID=A0A9P0G2N6_BEMTA|nr:unnamed protein product [Bemisia tabaci]
MRLLLFVGLLAVFCGHFTTSDGAVQPTKAPTKGDPATEFDKFVAKYNKKYPEDREKAKRFQIFKENLKEIERLNNRPRKGTVVYGVTKFADLTSDEFLKKHATHNVGDMSHLPNTNTLSDWADAETDFNWESKGAVTEIQDEGSCAASAAYATVAVIETFLWKATKNLVKLSEQQLIDCSTVTCSRGNHWDAFTKIVNMKGIQSKAVYSPKTKDCALKNGAAARVAYIEVNNRDEESMKNWVYNQGPIAVVINAKDMQFYVSGISNIDASECPLSPNRFVTLVGYGMQRYGGADFPYWIAKNSFGKDWGEKGYFRFARNINYCGVRHRPLSVAYDNSFSSTEVTGGPTKPAGTTKPPAGTTKPPAGTTKPPAGTTKPPAGTTKPPAGTTKPPAGTTKPPTKGPTKPASTTKPPANGPTKPASTTKPPTKGPTKPAVVVAASTTKQPTKGPTKPAGTTKPPTNGPTKPASTTKPPTKGPTKPAVIVAASTTKQPTKGPTKPAGTTKPPTNGPTKPASTTKPPTKGPTKPAVVVAASTTKQPTKGPTKPAGTTKPPTNGPTKPASTTKPPTKGPTKPAVVVAASTTKQPTKGPTKPTVTATTPKVPTKPTPIPLGGFTCPTPPQGFCTLVCAWGPQLIPAGEAAKYNPKPVTMGKPKPVGQSKPQRAIAGHDYD